MAGIIELAQFLPYVMRHVPGSPEFVAESYLRMSAIEFCERTRCWRKIVEVTIDESQTVAMVAPYYAAIHEIEYASFSNDGHPKAPLIPTQHSDLADRYRADLESQPGPPRYITQVNPNCITVFPVMPGVIELSLFLKPRMGQDFGPGDSDAPITDTLNVVPEFLLSQWGEVIANGALAKMLLQPQTKWYDPQRAAYFEGKFERACDSKFAQSMRGQHRAPKRTRFRFM